MRGVTDRRVVRGALCAAVLAAAGLVRADGDDEYHAIPFVKVGDRPPAFQLTDDEGRVWKSSQHFGKRPVVLYFYWGDFMPKCTQQACAYRDDLRRLAAFGVEVVGVSGDSPANHARFKEAYGLNFRLLADETGAVAKEFGVPVSGPSDTRLKDSRGKEFVMSRKATSGRWTFVVDRDGRVVYKDENPDPARDSRKVLAALEKLRAER